MAWPDFVKLALVFIFVEGAKAMSNPIDNCWMGASDWRHGRMKLADCAVGFGRAAMGGKGGQIYTVTSPFDNPLNPPPGTLRYAVTRKYPLWIVFSRDMEIRLQMPLFVASRKTIDARGATITIGNGPCIRLWNVSNIIIHGLNIHDCTESSWGYVFISEHRGIDHAYAQDGDGISVVTANNIWIDHNTLSNCGDGLIDVTLGSTAVTISNNRFFNHDEVMLLGNGDANVADKSMRVTVAFNQFGPGLVQRMPRVREGYVHVANNNYEPWGIYAIGGSQHPTILSEGNRFVAPDDEGKKQVTEHKGCDGPSCDNWMWRSVRDVFINGAYFVESGRGQLYKEGGNFTVGSGDLVLQLTRNSGVLTFLSL